MAKRIKKGDIFAVQISEQKFVAGIVLFKSNYFKNGVIVGIFNHIFTDISEIINSALDSYAFCFVPNYTSARLVTVWEVIGSNTELADQIGVPKLRVGWHIYAGDQNIGQIESLDDCPYPELRGQGIVYLENRIKKFFEV